MPIGSESSVIAEYGVPEGRSKVIRDRPAIHVCRGGNNDHWIVKSNLATLSLLRCCVTMTIVILRGDHSLHEQVSDHTVDAFVYQNRLRDQ